MLALYPPIPLRRTASLAAAALVLLTSPVRADIPTPLWNQTARMAGQAVPAFQLEYALTGQVKGFTYRANSMLHWQPRADGGYQIRMVTRKFPLGTRTQTSQGRVTPHGLRPDRMTDDWRGGQHVLFEWKHPPVLSFSKAGRDTQPLMAGAQDQVSLALHLAALVSATPGAFVPGKQLAVQVAGINGASNWLLGVAPPQAIHLNGTPHEAISLRQMAQPGQKKTTQVWLVRWGHAYLPAKIRVSEANGDYAEQLALRLPVLPAQPTTDQSPAAIPAASAQN